MFDLVGQIRSWREHLAGEGVYSPSDLDELESHLREEMTTLARTGLSEQETFAVACMRAGDSKDLSPEFAKVNGGMVFRSRLFWMGVGVLGYGLVVMLASVVSKGAILMAASASLRGHALGILDESVSVLALAIGILGLLVAVRKGPGSLTSPAWLHSTRGRIGLFAGLAVLSLALLAGQNLLTMGTTRLLGPSDIGEIHLVAAYVNLFWWMAGSLLLIGLVVKTWSSISAGGHASN